MEHFPPKRFLGKLETQTNLLVVWSICTTHNVAESAFIKALPNITALNVEFHWFKKQIDAQRVYRAVSEIDIRRFQAAFKANDHESATRAVQRSLSYLEALEPNFHYQEHLPGQDVLAPPRKKVGKKAHQPGRSRLP
jgi:hypothetical protein